MTLSITDPAFLFPGISLLILAYTNRYLTLAGIIRSLNEQTNSPDSANLVEQIQSLHLRIVLIKYMQALGVLAFIFCVVTMLLLLFGQQSIGASMFIISLASMLLSLCLALAEILMSGQSLKIELNRTDVS